MIASLPMYWTEKTAPSWQRLWARTRFHLGMGPDVLSVPKDLSKHWRDRNLILSQACSLPYRKRLHITCTLVGAFDFGLPDVPPGYYNSVIVARRGPLPEHPRMAVNALDSQSGWAALYEWIQTEGLGMKGKHFLSGSHAISARAVATGSADVAAIDAVTWRLIGPGIPLRTVAITRPTPGLPLITNRPGLAPALQDGLRRAVATMAPQDRDILGLRGFVDIPRADYMAEPLPPTP